MSVEIVLGRRKIFEIFTIGNKDEIVSEE